ncbi:MAG: phosphate signaling complex protein PhoU [Candidatus Hodarchaeota archaeon]
MSPDLHIELKRLRREVLEMGTLAKDMLNKSVEALIHQDKSLITEIKTKVATIRRFDAKIEEEALQAIALYQPGEDELRMIGCILKMITYLNIIGWYAKDISRAIQTFTPGSLLKKLVSLPHMRDLVCAMLEDALKAFESNEITPLQDLTQRDSTVDELYNTVFRKCLTYMLEDTLYITRGAQYIMVARYLERCGNHACKMAEKIHYVITGGRY